MTLPLKPWLAKANSLWQKGFWSCYFNLKVYIPVRGMVRSQPLLLFTGSFFQSLHIGLKGSCSSRQITSECLGSPPALYFFTFHMPLSLWFFFLSFPYFQLLTRTLKGKEERLLDTVVMGDLIKTQIKRQGDCYVSFTLFNCATVGWKHLFYK